MTNEVQKAMKTVIEALQNDPDYAWSWHCNIAMAYVDAGGDRYTGNQGAARFMKMLADVEPAHELPEKPKDELVTNELEQLREEIEKLKYKLWNCEEKSKPMSFG